MDNRVPSTVSLLTMSLLTTIALLAAPGAFAQGVTHIEQDNPSITYSGN